MSHRDPLSNVHRLAICLTCRVVSDSIIVRSNYHKEWLNNDFRHLFVRTKSRLNDKIYVERETITLSKISKSTHKTESSYIVWVLVHFLAEINICSVVATFWVALFSNIMYFSQMKTASVCYNPNGFFDNDFLITRRVIVKKPFSCRRYLPNFR